MIPLQTYITTTVNCKYLYWFTVSYTHYTFNPLLIGPEALKEVTEFFKKAKANEVQCLIDFILF